VDVFAIRHGETAWSLSGQHTGTTDIPLTDAGRRLPKRIRPVLAIRAFGLVLCNPLQRARETCELAGLGDKAIIDFDLVEWNYGEYEGLTPEQIEEMAPGWLIFRDGCPVARRPEHVSMRVDRVIARSRAVEGDFAHGHVLRVFAKYRLYGFGTDLSSTRSQRGRLCALRSLDNRRAIHAAAREQTHQP
jgi:broad specificity phosphatase PhoE